MAPAVEASFYVTEPPEIEYIDGMFHVTQTVGNYRFERVMRPHVFMLGLRRAAEAARKHRLGGADIIPFQRELDEAANSH
jgi:hypothetical protein